MSSSDEDLTTNLPIKPLESTQPQYKPLPVEPEMTPGRLKLRSWLNKTLRIKMTDGRILIGEFNCTDRDANVILGMCSEYAEEGGEERLIGLAMIPGKHIVSIEVDILGHNDLKEEITPMIPDDEMEEENTTVEVVQQ